jgi:hypothetical protein
MRCSIPSLTGWQHSLLVLKMMMALRYLSFSGRIMNIPVLSSGGEQIYAPTSNTQTSGVIPYSFCAIKRRYTTFSMLIIPTG